VAIFPAWFEIPLALFVSPVTGVRACMVQRQLDTGAVHLLCSSSVWRAKLALNFPARSITSSIAGHRREDIFYDESDKLAAFCLSAGRGPREPYPDPKSSARGKR
jgi:hypothetical protein